METTRPGKESVLWRWAFNNFVRLFVEFDPATRVPFQRVGAPVGWKGLEVACDCESEDARWDNGLRRHPRVDVGDVGEVKGDWDLRFAGDPIES